MARQGDPLGFFNIHCCKTSKIEGGPFEEIFLQKKSHNAEKTECGDPLVSPGIACYAEKRKTPFGSVR